MLNQILQIFLLALAAIILTTGVAMGNPLSSDVLITATVPNPDAAISQPAPSPQPSDATQPDTHDLTKAELEGDRSVQLKDNQPLQADPSVPYDPYDFDAIREMDREIYGEVKPDKQG
jgi:hypothetical protein